MLFLYRSGNRGQGDLGKVAQQVSGRAGSRTQIAWFLLQSLCSPTLLGGGGVVPLLLCNSLKSKTRARGIFAFSFSRTRKPGEWEPHSTVCSPRTLGLCQPQFPGELY